MTRQQGFTQAAGNWIGTAEVYDGRGRFLGNATDRRHVTKVIGENRVRIELSFVGPMKFSGHYFIEDHKTHRLYQGPINVGYAETLAHNLIDANAYWAVTGLTQRFFLVIMPDGNKQMSLGLMSRGEHMMYAVVGEYNRVSEENDAPSTPPLISGTHYDMQDDPAAGRGEILLHREGTWSGTVLNLDGNLDEKPASEYEEHITDEKDCIHVVISNPSFNLNQVNTSLKTDGWQAWSDPGDLAGSYSLSGGRALSGQFHYLTENLRVWRREVASHDGTIKFILNYWYRGGERIGAQFGVLKFTSLA